MSSEACGVFMMKKLLGEYDSSNEREFKEVSEAAWSGSAARVIECPLLQREKKPKYLRR